MNEDIYTYFLFIDIIGCSCWLIQLFFTEKLVPDKRQSGSVLKLLTAKLYPVIAELK